MMSAPGAQPSRLPEMTAEALLSRLRARRSFQYNEREERAGSATIELGWMPMARLKNRLAEVLEPDEVWIEDAIMTTGSIRRAAYSGGGGTIRSRVVLTDRRLLFFTSSDLAFNMSVGKMIGEVPLSQLTSIEIADGRVAGVKMATISLTSVNGESTVFEASGAHLRDARRLAETLGDLLAEQGDTKADPEGRR